MKINTAVKREPLRTHGGALAFVISPLQQLRRSVLACLLWEGEFYEDGQTIAGRIRELVSQCKPADVAELAIEARNRQHLRHVPLLLARELARHPAAKGTRLVGDTIYEICQRADEPAEFLALYWADGKQPLSAQVKQGLARAMRRFSAYELGKYNRDGAVKLRDVLFLTHARPKDAEQARIWKQLVDGTLPAPDTWEVALSTGQNKRETWERLIRQGKLGYLALLRNLRNMEMAGVDQTLVREAILARKGADRVLSFRYFAAAREAPAFESELDRALLGGAASQEKLAGKTLIVLDVSESMRALLSSKSTLTRLDAGAALAALAAAQCENPIIYATAGNDHTRIHATRRLPRRQGMALRDAFVLAYEKLGGGGIFLKPVLDFLKDQEKSADRLIVITDEQDCAIDQRDSPKLAKPFGQSNYLINVASAKHGVGYGSWTHVDGFSEAVLDYIRECEKPAQ